jgi:hypothetical protein
MRPAIGAVVLGVVVNHGLDCRTAAVVVNHHWFDAGHRDEHFAGEMSGRSCPRRRHPDLVRVGFDQGNQFLQGRDRQRGIAGYKRRLNDEARDGR